jgi:hypothetical protein
MDDDDTDPADGAAAITGAVQEESFVWAPYQVASADFHTSQQVPSAERSARVMLPVGPPVASSAWPGLTAMLIVDEFELGPATKVTEGSEPESSEGVMAP